MSLFTPECNKDYVIQKGENNLPQMCVINEKYKPPKEIRTKHTRD